MKPSIITLMAVLALLASPSAALYIDAGLPKTALLEPELLEFEQTAGISMALATTMATEDIIADAEAVQGISDADLVIVYDLGSNRIAIAKPLDRDVLSDEKITAILTKRGNEKLLIADEDDAAAYLSNVINDMRDELSREGQILGTCSLIKDGLCDGSCYGDLDCDCGNGICDYHENSNTCPKDCPRTADFGCAIISDNYCDKSCPVKDIDCVFSGISDSAFEAAKKKRAAATVLKVVTGSLFFIMMAVLIFIMEKRGGLRRKR